MCLYFFALVGFNMTKLSKQKKKYQKKVIKSAKLFGIHLKGRLNFDFYVSTLTKKTSRNLMFLQEFAIS